MSTVHIGEKYSMNFVIPLYSPLCPLQQTRVVNWFQTFSVFCMLYGFFWVIPQHLNFICQRFRTLCLFHPHRQLGVEWLNLRIVWVSIRENVWLQNSYFRAKPSRVWISHQFSNLVILHLPAYEDGTECSETSAYKIQTPGNCPEENIQQGLFIFIVYTLSSSKCW